MTYQDAIEYLDSFVNYEKILSKDYNNDFKSREFLKNWGNWGFFTWFLAGEC